MWLQLASDSAAAPCSRAMSRNRAAPKRAPVWPIPHWQSTMAMAPLRFFTRGRCAGRMVPAFTCFI